jgi:hypothetical protein
MKPVVSETEERKKKPWRPTCNLDMIAIALSGAGRGCIQCDKITLKEYLVNDLCPDCREKL